MGTSGFLPPRKQLRTIGVLSLAHTINDSYAYVLQAVLPALIVTFGLSLGLAGVLVTIYQLTSSVVQPVVGHLADRSAMRWPAWAGVALSGIGAGLLGLAPNYVALLGLLVIAGVGTAIFHPVSAAMIGTAAPPHVRGRWLGIYVTAGNLGLAIGPLSVGWLLERVGPTGTWPILVPALLMSVAVATLAPRRVQPTTAHPPLRSTLRKHRRLLSALVLVITLRAVASAGLSTFIPLLGRGRGLGFGDAAFVLTAYLLAGAAGGLLGGFAADRWGRDRVLTASLLLSVPFGLLVALRADTGPLLILWAALAGFFLNGSFVVLAIRGQESIPGSVGLMTGITLGLSVGLGGAAVTPLAFLGEQMGIPAAAALAVCLGGGAALASRLLPPPAARTVERGALAA